MSVGCGFLRPRRAVRAHGRALLIAVDTNVLVYAHRAGLRPHARASARLDVPWAVPVFCLGEFVRVVTHPRLFDPPFADEEACDALRRVLESPSLQILHPGERYPELLFQAIIEARAAGNLVFDAQIVAPCSESGASSLLTEDRDFARFTLSHRAALTTRFARRLAESGR